MRTVVLYSTVSELFDILVCRMWAEGWTVKSAIGEQVDLEKRVRSYKNELSLVPKDKLKKSTYNRCREVVRFLTNPVTPSLQKAFEALTFSNKLATILFNGLSFDDRRLFTQIKVLLQKRNESRL